jgi:hypothetical protein
MAPRLIVAYSLILLLAISSAVLFGYRRYYSDRRKYVRRLRGEDKLYEQIMSEQGNKPSE